jgi:hypothetical protein
MDAEKYMKANEIRSKIFKLEILNFFLSELIEGHVSKIDMKYIDQRNCTHHWESNVFDICDISKILTTDLQVLILSINGEVEELEEQFNKL